jgi:hypothetical protein
MLPPHEVMQAQLQHFGALLTIVRDRVQLCDRFRCHAEFGVTARSPELPLEVHGTLF